MKRSENMMNFLSAYEDYVLNILNPKKNQLKQIFESWKDQNYWKKYQENIRHPIPSPVQHTRTRVKRPESLIDKIMRKPDSFPDGLCMDSVRKMGDALGGRVVVYFLSGLPILDREIRNQPLIEICEDDQPIAYLGSSTLKKLGLGHIKQSDKDSGYASIHYTVKLKDSDIPENDNPRLELQIRTLAENIWGEIEHILGYKPGTYTSLAVKKQFQIISFQLQTIDEHFNFLFEELTRFQEEVDIKDSYPLNAENLPTVLQKLGISCSQREIGGLLKLLASRGFSDVGSLLKTASVKTMETISNTYRVHEGRNPVGYEIVANLAAVRNVSDETEVNEIVKAQIEFLKAWEKLKKEMK